LLRTLVKARNDEPLTDDESVALSIYFARVWLGLQQTIGNTTATDLEIYIRLHRRTFESLPMLRELWRIDREVLNPEFAQFMEQEVIRQTEVE
jgi:hypothetical protein